MATVYDGTTTAPTGGLPNRNASKKPASVFAREKNWFYGFYTWTAAHVINDEIRLVLVPKGSKVFDANFEVPDMDTSTGLTLDLGYGGAGSGTSQYWVAASTVGQAGGVARKAAVGSVPIVLSTTADDTIDVYIHAAATGTALAAGTMWAAGLIEPTTAQDSLSSPTI